MRHSRKSVMAEQYKLYIRKNIFNGRYLVRNIQLGFCIILTIAVIIGMVMIFNSGAGKDTKSDSAMKINDPVSVKDALFGNKETIDNSIADNGAADAEEYLQNSEDENVPTEADAAQSVSTESITEAVAAFSETEAAVVSDNASVDDAEEKEAESEFEDRCIANVDETLNVRKEPSRDSEFVGSMEKGSIAKVLDRDGEWTKIKSGDVEGYVLSEYVLTGKIAEEFSKNYVTIQGTAKEDGVNVRENKSTDSDILKVLEKDEMISVVENDSDDQSAENDSSEDNYEEENSDDTVSDDIDWVTVMLDDGQIGYVSADYVEVDKLYTLAVSAEELIRREEERAAAERAAAEAAILAAQQTEEAASSNSSSNTSNDDSSSYQGAKTTPVTAAESGESLGTFTITAYCGCSKCSGGHNKTATGTTPTEGRTIAADTSVLPYGTQVVIGGIVYTVEDCGSGVNGNHIDIFFATHEDALAFGTKTMTVYKY